MSVEFIVPDSANEMVRVTIRNRGAGNAVISGEFVSHIANEEYILIVLERVTICITGHHTDNGWNVHIQSFNKDGVTAFHEHEYDDVECVSMRPIKESR